LYGGGGPQYAIHNRRLRCPHQTQKADALETRAAAAEETQYGDAAADGDDGDRYLIDGDQGSGRNGAKYLEIELRLAVGSHPNSKADECSTKQLNRQTNEYFTLICSHGELTFIYLFN